MKPGLIAGVRQRSGRSPLAQGRGLKPDDDTPEMERLAASPLAQGRGLKPDAAVVVDKFHIGRPSRRGVD